MVALGNTLKDTPEPKFKFRYFSPASITAFFSPFHGKNPEDFENIGSTGVGINLESGVTAELERSDSVEIRLNSRKFTFPTLDLVLEKLIMGYSDIGLNLNLKSDIPPGYGFGFSASACLSSAFAVSEALNMNKGFFEVADLVHECEVRCATGLGDVVCQSYGGVVVRKKAGAPSKARVEKFLFDKEINFLMLGDISTSKILKDDEIVRSIQYHGGIALEKFLRNPTFDSIFLLSNEFALKTGLMDDEVLEIIREVEHLGYKASMVMLGKVVFTDCPTEILKEYGDVFSSKISQFGIRRA
jgi:pantoate kinase